MMLTERTKLGPYEFLVPLRCIIDRDSKRGC